jgi:hypothetical protein
MLWEFLVSHAKDYGFLGPIVGIAGLLLGAGTAILFAFTKSVNVFKPPEGVLIPALVRIVTLMSAIGIFAAWFLAEPTNGRSYLNWAITLAIISVVSFIVYIGIRSVYARFKKPTVVDNEPGPDEDFWGGFWLTPRAKEARKNGTIEAFLAGNNFKAEEVWPPWSRGTAMVVTAILLIAILAGGTLALATASAAVQVALTGKAARAVISTSQVPGLPPDQSVPSKPSPSPAK